MNGKKLVIRAKPFDITKLINSKKSIIDKTILKFLHKHKTPKELNKEYCLNIMQKEKQQIPLTHQEEVTLGKIISLLDHTLTTKHKLTLPQIEFLYYLLKEDKSFTSAVKDIYPKLIIKETKTPAWPLSIKLGNKQTFLNFIYELYYTGLLRKYDRKNKTWIPKLPNNKYPNRGEFALYLNESFCAFCYNKEYLTFLFEELLKRKKATHDIPKQVSEMLQEEFL